MAIPWSALLLGVIEGITEFLPISSTGHLLVAEQWLGARSDLFNIAIQSGAILAVTFVYRDRLGGLVRGIRQPENRVYAGQLALAFIVTAAFGFGAMHLGFKLPTGVQPVAWALVLGASGCCLPRPSPLGSREATESLGLSLWRWASRKWRRASFPDCRDQQRRYSLPC